MKHSIPYNSLRIAQLVILCCSLLSCNSNIDNSNQGQDSVKTNSQTFQNPENLPIDTNLVDRSGSQRKPTAATQYRPEDITSKNAKYVIEYYLGKQLADYWNTKNKNNEKNDVTFAKDILTVSYGDFSNNIKDPTLIDVYLKNITSDYRADITLLRYFAYRANIAYDFIERNAASTPPALNSLGKEFKSKCKECRGSNMWIEKTGSINIIKCNNTIVGELEYKNEKYEITCSEDDGILLNMPILLSSAYYNIKHKGITETVQTDKYGRKEIIDATIYGKERFSRTSKDRIQYIISGFNHLFGLMLLNERMNTNLLHVSDNGGHIIPVQWGGLEEGTNIFPQNEDLNQGRNGVKTWKAAEESGAKALEEGKNVELKIEFFYPDHLSLRPYKLSRYQKNGIEVVCNNLMDNPIVEGEETNFEEEDYILDKDNDGLINKIINFIKSII